MTIYKKDCTFISEAEMTVKDFQLHIVRVAGVKEIWEFIGDDISRIKFVEKVNGLAGRGRKSLEYQVEDIDENTVVSDGEWDELDSELRTLLNRLN